MLMAGFWHLHEPAQVMHEILAIRYAHLDRLSDQNFLGGDPRPTPMPLDYYVWVIRRAGRIIVVDTGFDAAAAAARGRQLTRPVADGLRAAGIDPETVSDVVITHLHYDHAGNIELFPRARLHLQDAEMTFCSGRAMTHQHVAAPFDAERVADMVRNVFRGRVVFHTGEATLTEGITLHLLPGHTAGLQAVRVATSRGPVVLASDAAHFWANIERECPFPIVADVPAYLESLRKLQQLAPSLEHIIPGHDPLVMERFPAEPGVPDAVRLDLPPRKSPRR